MITGHPKNMRRRVHIGCKRCKPMPDSAQICVAG